MPPKGWKKNKSIGGKRMLEAPVWNKAFVPFGDRLDFLSPERQHLNTGRLRILPPRNPERREHNAD